MANTLEKHSKFLSYVLRHKPDAIGLTLDAEGWAHLPTLISCAAAHGTQLDLEQIREIVRSNDKQRFALDEAGQRIRANQGHSVSVELGLQAVTPPATLYHGTATRFLDSIREQGLRAGSRQHVHLSALRDTAVNVGSRHGKPQVLVVNARAMHGQGHAFYCSDNGVWLTAAVPVGFIEFGGE